MKKLFLLILAFTIAYKSYAQYVNIPDNVSEKITPRLSDVISTASKTNSRIQAIIILKDQFDLQALDKQLRAEKASPQERAYKVITGLQGYASKTQINLEKTLNSKSKSEVSSYKDLWIINAIALEASVNTILSISKHQDIDYIDLPEQLKLIEPVNSSNSKSIPDNTEPGLKAINAHKLWEIGITGKGVVVGNLDTGVEGTHPALAASWRGNDPGVEASEAWWDPEGSTFPYDWQWHGTETTGIMVGLDPDTHDTTGVAFDARWIAASQPWEYYWMPRLDLLALQWFLDPDGFPETIDDMPIVVNNSWGVSTECNPYLKSAIDALEVAGIATTWAAGNTGPGPGTIWSPACLNTTEINVFSVGAVDPNSVDLPIWSLSSRGPTFCTGEGNQIKPEVVAPGANVRFPTIGGSYKTSNGTSLASPHVCGAVALLKQAFPDKTGPELLQLLYDTARDLGEPGEDNAYGKGVIDVWAAYLALAVSTNPRPPIAVKPYSDYIMPDSVQITWLDPTQYEGGDPLTGFDITIRRDNQLIDSVASGIGSYTDTGLTEGQYYAYQIQARDLISDSVSIPIEIYVYAGGSPFPSQPDSLKYSYDNSRITLSWKDPVAQTDGTFLDDLAKIYIYRNNNLIDSVAPGIETYTDSSYLLPGSTVIYYVKAVDNEMPANLSSSSHTINCFVGVAPDYLVWLGTYAVGTAIASAESIFEAIAANGESVFLSNNLFEFGTDLSMYKAIFVVLGIPSGNHFLERTDEEPAALENYLANGGKIYLEGADCFYTKTGQYNIKPWFGLDYGAPDAGDIFEIRGLYSFAPSSFIYTGKNLSMDELEPQACTPIWQNESSGTICGVWSNSFGEGLAIGVVPSFGDLVDNPDKLNKVAPPQNIDPSSINQKILPYNIVETGKFVKKYDYRPELKKNREKAEYSKFISNTGKNINVSTKAGLMAAYLSLFEANPRYRVEYATTNLRYNAPGTDSLRIRAHVLNPEAEELSVQAHIESFNHNLKDTISLFDDGMHNDSTAGDGLYGGSWKIPDNERFYNFDISTISSDTGFCNVLINAAKFTTVGPVVIDHYYITSTDTIPDVDDNLRYSFILLNRSLTDTVKSISTEIVTLDTLAYSSGFRNYGNIPPGETAESVLPHSINFLYDGFNTNFVLLIKSDKYHFWSDTFSVVPSSMEDRITHVPMSFDLFQNYPNPTTGELTIEFEKQSTTEITIELLDICGKVVYTTILNPGETRHQINLSSFEEGLYLIRISNTDYTVTKKVIKID